MIDERIKHCYLCVSFRTRMSRSDECTHPKVNAAFPPFLVDGNTFQACLNERGSVSNPCGTAGKLYQAVKTDEASKRLKLVQAR